MLDIMIALATQINNRLYDWAQHKKGKDVVIILNTKKF
jgi:hypothetical protein